jgi:hypothetical protein
MQQLVMTHDVFISHSSKDKLTADAICHSLEQNGIRCWIAPRDVRAGANYGAEIMRGIKNCRLLILIFSGNSNASLAVVKEIEIAFSNGKTIIPFRIDNAKISDDLSFYIAGNHWIDAYPDDKVFRDLVNSVRKTLGMPVVEPVTQQGSTLTPPKPTSNPEPVIRKPVSPTNPAYSIKPTGKAEIIFCDKSHYTVPANYLYMF